MRNVTRLAVSPSPSMVQGEREKVAQSQGPLDDEFAVKEEDENALDDDVGFNYDSGVGKSSSTGENSGTGNDSGIGEDSSDGEDGNVDEEVSGPDTGEEQDDVSRLPLLELHPLSIQLRGNLYHSFSPHDTDDNQPGRTRLRTKSPEQDITLMTSVMSDPVHGPVDQTIDDVKLEPSSQAEVLSPRTAKSGRTPKLVSWEG